MAVAAANNRAEVPTYGTSARALGDGVVPLALERVLTDVRERWGQGSIVRLDAPSSGGALTLPAAQRRAARGAQPPWWPLTLPDGAVARPGVVEVLAPPGSGRLTLALAWLAAARPTLAALVTAAEQSAQSEPQSKYPTLSGGIPFPPSVAQLGVDLERLILVRPPRVLDAVAILLRSEAFDVVVCVLPPRTRVSTTFAGKLATLASRSGTTLFLVSTPRHVKRAVPPAPKRFVVPFTVIEGGRPAEAPPAGDAALPWTPSQSCELRSRSPGASPPGPPGLLAAFADYRLTLTTTRPLWRYTQLAGLKLRIRTERARGAADTDAPPGEHTQEMTLAYEGIDSARKAIVSWSPTSVGDARSAPAGNSITPSAVLL